MDSITIGWKKQTPGEVEIATKEKYFRNHPARKVKIIFFFHETNQTL
jgi:hypothetical protein